MKVGTTKYNLDNTTMWAVVSTCTVKNDGKIEERKKIIATFVYPFQAEDFIKKCLPEENRDKFEVTAL